MKKLNYIFETACLLDPLSLQDERLKDLKYHFYMVVSTPTIYIKDCYRITNGIGFVLCIGNDEVKIEVPNSNATKTIEYKKYECCDIGRTEVVVVFDIVNEDGSVVESTSKCSALDLYYRFAKERRMRIEYIGQSYAVDGHRTSQMRLMDHSTLQKILAEYSRGNRRDVMLILLGADISVFNSAYSSHFITVDDVDEETKNSYVNLLEAFLINYFKPKYNKKFINGTVPSTSHDSYKEVINEKFEDFSVNVCIQGVYANYELYTEEKTIRVNEGVLELNQRIHVDFESANLIKPSEYHYSFENEEE